jgi:hypothetical protein
MGSGTFVGSGEGALRDTVNLSGVLGQDERLLAAGEHLTYEVPAFAPDVADDIAASRLQCAPGTPVRRLERIRRSGGTDRRNGVSSPSPSGSNPLPGRSIRSRRQRAAWASASAV